MKLSRHNGRAGKDGVYHVRHNDRKFNTKDAEHIDEKMSGKNVYWDCYQGYYSKELIPRPDGEIPAEFLNVEKLYYYEHYSDFCEKQNERNKKARHYNRDRTTEDLRLDKRTCPEESILQIGNIEETVTPDVLVSVVEDYYKIFNEKFSEHIHIIDWSLHLDEASPHIHERHVFDSENKYGEIAPQQEKTLELLGFELPNPEKPKGRYNNRKITFDKYCKSLLHEIAKKHGLKIEEKPEYDGRAYLEKQDYILMKQKERIANQEKKLEELEITISDTEKFVEKISDVAYEKAVEVVTEKVVEETHNADFEMIEDLKKAITAPESKNKPEVKKIAGQVLDRLMGRFQGFTRKISEKLSKALRNPAVKERAKEPIKASILEELKQAKVDKENQPKFQERVIKKNRNRGSELE